MLVFLDFDGVLRPLSRLEPGFDSGCQLTEINRTPIINNTEINLLFLYTYRDLL